MTESASIDPAEVAKFSAIAAEWWDPAGKFAPLHKFNPVRLAFIRQQVADRFGRDPTALRPFEGLSLLDIGCGGGLLSEPMARLGFAVTGADASEKNIGRSAQLVAYSSTAVWVSGIFYIIPSLGILGILGLYGIYLFYLGIPVMKKTPEDKRVIYMVVSAIVLIVVGFVLNMIVSRVMYAFTGNPFLT